MSSSGAGTEASGATIIDRIDRASQLRREEPVLHILHLGCARHEATAMNVHNGGQWVVGRDRAIGQTRIAFAPNALSTWISSATISARSGLVMVPMSSSKLCGVRQRISSQRFHRPQRERIAQFGVDKFYGAEDLSCVRSRPAKR